MGHAEMICVMVHQLTKGATADEMKEAGLGGTFAQHGLGIYPSDANGVPFTAAVFASTGDPIADLVEDMAAEEKVRATYENLIQLTDDEDIIRVLLFYKGKGY